MNLRPFLLAALLAFAAGPASATVILVNTLEGTSTTNGNCALREAIQAAALNAAVDACPAGGGDDVIAFTVTGTIAWTAQATISSSVTILGPGADRLRLDAGGAGNGANRHFWITGTGTTVRISGLALAGGASTTVNDTGGALLVDGTGNGVNATLHLADCRLEGNSVLTGRGGAVEVYEGTLTADRCLFGGNTATSGGAISAVASHVTLTNSTFSGNAAGQSGGAYYASYNSSGLFGGSLNISRSTFSGNTASSHGGALYVFDNHPNQEAIESVTLTNNTTSGDGGGIYLSSGIGFTVRNTIAAANADNSGGTSICPDLWGNFVSGGHSLIGQPGLIVGVGLCADDFVDGQNGNIVGAFGNSIDPVLSPLGDYGGPTPTHTLLAGSPASDTGSCAGERHDQRGYYNPATNLRPANGLGAGSACDIGATEEAAFIPPSVTLAPQGGQPVVVARGERLRFSATFKRSSIGPFSVRYRTEALLPNGTVYSLVPLTTIQVSGGAGTTVSFDPRVPNAAPAGAYVYRIYVETTDGFVRATDFFQFRVTASSPRGGTDEGLADAGELALPGAMAEEAATLVTAETPEAIALAPAYPNPSAGTTTLQFTLPSASPVRLSVYDALGREIAVLVDEEQEAGQHEAVLDGRALPAGVYLVRMTAGPFVQTQRLTLVR